MDIAIKYYKKYDYDSKILGNLDKELSEIFTRKSINPLVLKNKNFEF